MLLIETVYPPCRTGRCYNQRRGIFCTCATSGQPPTPGCNRCTTHNLALAPCDATSKHVVRSPFFAADGVLSLTKTRPIEREAASTLQETETASDGVQQTHKETNLHLFAEKGNLEEVRRCLANGEMVDERNTRRQTPLHGACTGGHRDVVDILLQQGADVTAKDDHLVSVLHCAAVGGNEDVVKALLSAGASINARDDDSCTPLHLACMHGNVAAVRVLVEDGANALALDTRKRTPVEVIGETFYVNQNVSKKIRTIVHSAAGGFREKAVKLKREKEAIRAELETMAIQLRSAEAELGNAQEEIAQLKRQGNAMEIKNRELREVGRHVVQRRKRKKCTIM